MAGTSTGGETRRALQAPREWLRAWWRRRVPFVISVGFTAFALTIYAYTFIGDRPTAVFTFINRLELNALDLRFRLRPEAYKHPDPRIIIVDIDQRSQEVLGRWPFSRTYFARMLDTLREDGAKVAAFDITFSKPDETAAPIRELRQTIVERQKQGGTTDERVIADLDRLSKEYDGDAQFARAIEKFGNVVLGNFFLYSEYDLKGVDDKTLDRYANILADFTFPQVRAANPQTGQRDLLHLIQGFGEPYSLIPKGTQANIEILSDALRKGHGATGFFNVEPDADGVVRHSLLVLPYGRSKNLDDWDLYGSLDVQAVRLFQGLPDQQMVLDFSETGVTALEFGPSLILRPDAAGRIMINYEGDAATYPYVSIADVVRHKFPAGTFKGKIVLIGASATGIGDLQSTPFGGIDYPGVEVHANMIDNIMNRHFLLRGANQVAVDLLLILLFGVPLGLWLALAQPRSMLFGLLLLVPFGVGVWYAFLHGWWLNFIVPAGILVANVGFVAMYRALVEEKEKRRVRGAFQQYLSPEVIRRLLENPDLVKPRKTEITVMFSDVRGFTSISEKLDAQELAALLNEYLTDMTRIVFRHNGTLDKYIGDAVMAFWGAPFEEQDHATKSCHAALEMMARLAEMQKKWRSEGRPVLDIGVGLCTGVASVGNMGSELRYGYTALGDTVNLSSRLEGLNKEYATHILLSDTTYAAVEDPLLVFRELDLIRVKGKLQPVTLYELVAARDTPEGDAPDLEEHLEYFAQGRACYRERRWQDAQIVFEKLLERWPEDGPARMYLNRCKEYRIAGPEENWDGVYVMTHK
ncbi:MAG TPA: adenylate/guanylate cyclase domain-containing protein [Candidatus Acidoferrales bacterium]|jgi:adenylate cyclase|nr:adenylate/guanylate cyclase domain-containing protein [Candidatus Acidoferrales bacterium]